MFVLCGFCQNCRVVNLDKVFCNRKYVGYADLIQDRRGERPSVGLLLWSGFYRQTTYLEDAIRQEACGSVWSGLLGSWGRVIYQRLWPHPRKKRFTISNWVQYYTNCFRVLKFKRIIMRFSPLCSTILVPVNSIDWSTILRRCWKLELINLLFPVLWGEIHNISWT